MEEKKRSFADRLSVGLVVGVAVYFLANLSPEGYEMRNVIGILGFCLGFFFDLTR